MDKDVCFIHLSNRFIKINKVVTKVNFTALQINLAMMAIKNNGFDNNQFT